MRYFLNSIISLLGYSLFIETIVTVGLPQLIHFQIVFPDKALYLADFRIAQSTLLLNHSATVTADKKLRGSTLGQLGIAGVNVHAFDDTEGSVV
jgi:hypothetical protein